MPFRAIRNKLRLIRYYSATRPYNRWSRALDIALAAALVLALPTAWVLDGNLVRRTWPDALAGKLFKNPDGPVWAWVGFPSMPPQDVQGEATFYGTFQVEVKTEDRGWPFISSRRTLSPELTVGLFVEPLPRANDDLPVHAPLRLAIVAALSHEGLSDAAAAVRRDPAASPPVSKRLAAWAANALIWALLLPITAWVIVSLLRLAWLPIESAHHARRQQRRREDRCANCGYDLRASGFSGRCPECGTLVQ
jgi:hypothetical protein